MMDAMLLGIVPSAWLVVAADVLRTVTDKGARRRRLLPLSAVALAILLVLAIRVGPLTDPVRLLYLLGVALSPALCGGLALLLLRRRMTRGNGSLRDKVIFVAVTAAALIVSTLVADIMPFPLYVLLCTLVIAGVWRLWDWAGRWCPIPYVLELVLLVIAIGAADYRTPLPADATWLSFPTQLARFFWVPAMAVIMVARFFQQVATTRSWRGWPRILLMALLSIPLLVLLAYQMLLTSVWDVATDGLGSSLLSLFISLTAIASAIVLAWSLTGQRRWAALAFALIVPLVMSQAQEIANYYPNGEWGMMPGFMTERRAEIVNGAIRGYYAANGHYPDALSDLIPWNLVYIPPPLIIPGQTWCYEGGTDYYRLAYVYREYFSSPKSVRIHASAGNLPNTAPACP